jgi:hypothetical protein
MVRSHVVVVLVVLALSVAAWGVPDPADDSDCVPTIDASVPPVGDPNRKIEIRTPDVDALPSGFGNTAPPMAYIIVETDNIIREE